MLSVFLNKGFAICVMLSFHDHMGENNSLSSQFESSLNGRGASVRVVV